MMRSHCPAGFGRRLMAAEEHGKNEELGLFELVAMGVGGTISVSSANFRLRARTKRRTGLVVLGLVLMTVTVTLLLVYLWQSSRETLVWIAVVYGVVIAAELLFSKRRLPILSGEA